MICPHCNKDTNKRPARAVVRGRRIQAARRAAKLTQMELSSLVGISQSTLSRVEGGRAGMISVDHLRAIADACGVAFDDLSA